MNATDLCLIIDNDRDHLGLWLLAADTTSAPMDAHSAKYWFSKPANSMLHREVLDLIAERIDWEEVAEHYATKVREGTSLPKAKQP